MVYVLCAGGNDAQPDEKSGGGKESGVHAAILPYRSMRNAGPPELPRCLNVDGRVPRDPAGALARSDDPAAADEPHQEQHDGNYQQHPDKVAERIAADHPE